jgi:ABC-type branched-subunit amino acid transport system ATPase component/ABC-type branched-subunit amino acid transport system permease subunit
MPGIVNALKGAYNRAAGTISKIDNRILWAALALVFIAFPFGASNAYIVRIGGTILLYVVLGTGLNFVVGLAGVLDMGYTAFYAMGAYTYALLASPMHNYHMSFWILLPLAMFVAAFTGLIIGMPSLRLRGDYLAITTMGFAQITRLLLLNLDKPVNITNGPNGIVKVDPAKIFGYVFDGSTAYYYLIGFFAIVVVAATYRLRFSRIGRAWAAIRDDEVAATCMGINPASYKLLAFAVGASAAGIAGVLFAAWQESVFPEVFSMNELINIYCMIVLGGTGNPLGPLLGSLLLVTLGEALREYSIYRMIIYATILLLMMRYRPQGLLVSKPRVSDIDVDDVLAEEAREREKHSRKVSPTKEVLLDVKHLTKAFGGIKAVTDVSFHVCKGEILSIIGPNGAGKTTLFNLITGMHRPDTGSVVFAGQNIFGMRAYQVVKKGLARTFQNIRVFPQMSVLDNVMVGLHPRLKIKLAGAVFQPPWVKKAEAEGEREAARHLAFFGHGMLSRKNDFVSTLNYADRRRVEIARALTLAPKMLLLDEPAAGMNMGEIGEITRQISELRDRGYTIVLVEHQMSVVMNISDRIVVMNKGEKLAEGTPAEIQGNSAVVEAYLGTRREVEPIAAYETVASEGVQPLLSLKGVNAQYGQIRVLKEISLEVYPGETVCLLGANAAGKSTTIKTIIGNVRATHGEIEFKGQRIETRSTPEIINAGIAIVPEGRRIFSRLTVEENLEVGGFISTDSAKIRRGIERAYEQFPILKERRLQKAGTLSGGEQQMLAIARALMTEPTLLCLDEPSMGLSPVLVEQVFAIIREINKAGTTVFMVEQNATQALAIAHRGYVIQTGSIVMGDRADRLLANEDMKRAYLGETSH